MGKSNPAYNGNSYKETSKQCELDDCDKSDNVIKRVVLGLTSFLIPGTGLSADNCMSKIVSAVSSAGNALKIVSKHCERIQCPNCYNWWVSQRTFKLAVLLECYAKHTGERPAGFWVSVHADSVKSWTWQDYCNFFRTGYNRLYKLGVLGGVRVFHPFRVKDSFKDEFRKLGAKDSGGFWKMIREDVLHLPSWYSYVKLSPHLHIMGFPSFIESNTTSDITIGKYAVFDNVTDVVAHLRYLLSHCGNLTDGMNEPASVFGCLHGFKPDEHLTQSEIVYIKNNVASAMDLCYDSVRDIVIPDDDVDDSGHDWIPLHEFADYSNEQEQFVTAFITGIKNPEHRIFVDNVISLYNDKRIDTSLKKQDKHVFIDDLGDVPDGFELVFVDEVGGHE